MRSSPPGSMTSSQKEYGPKAGRSQNLQIWDGTAWFGTSALALQRLWNKYGYVMVYCDKSMTNCFGIYEKEFIKNEEKTNASVCRNIGVDNSKYDNVIFLDADDSIGNNFVLNREIQFKDFAI